MFTLRIFSWPSWALFIFFVAAPVRGQDSTPSAQPPEAAQTAPSASTRKRIVFDDFVDSVVRQERRANRMGVTPMSPAGIYTKAAPNTQSAMMMPTISGIRVISDALLNIHLVNTM
jgi:hypothetical protein